MHLGKVFNKSRSGVPPRSVPFWSEEALVAEFGRALRKGAPDGWSLLREVNAGVGVADLILVQKPTVKGSDLRQARAIPLRLAALLDPGVAPRIGSMSDFMMATGMPRSAALRTVRELTAARVARRHGEELVIRGLEALPFSNVVAIEAKLRDWKRALTQAYRNRQFATQSWVVLDGHYSVSELALDSFRKAHIGLATCSTLGRLEILVHTDTMPPSSRTRTWAAQAMIARSNRQALRPLK